MAFSKATLISRVRRTLNDNPFQDTCTEAMDATETGLDVASTTLYAKGNIVEFQDDGEQCLVTALASATELTVVRGYNGTTGATHSINAAIVVDPTVQYIQIEQAVTAVMQGLWPYVWKLRTYTLTPSDDPWYELDDASSDVATIIEIGQVVQVISSGSDERPFFYGENGASYPANLHFNLPTAISASTVGIHIPYKKHATNSIYVTGLCKVTPTISGGNYSDISEGIQVNTVVFLAVAHLIASLDVSRTTAEDVDQGETGARPLTRTQLADYWERKGVMERNKWRIDLDATNPKRPRSGRRGRRHAR